MERFLLFIIGASVCLCVYIAFVMMPYAVYAEAECLDQGYPESKVTFGFSRYCLTTEGVVVPKVIKQD